MTKCNKCGYDYSGSGDSAHPCMPVNVQQRTWVGLNHDEVPEQYKYAQLWLKRIDEAIQAEREACAKVCESLSLEWEDQPNIAQAEVATKMDCAQAIRARGGEEARIKRLEKYLIRRAI